MNNYNDLIGQLVEYRTESYQMTTGEYEPNPVALGLIAEVAKDTGDEYIRVEWLVNPHDYTLFNVSEINKFGLTLKDSEDWGL
jgi:hypothetical protein